MLRHRFEILRDVERGTAVGVKGDDKNEPLRPAKTNLNYTRLRQESQVFKTDSQSCLSAVGCLSTLRRDGVSQERPSIFLTKLHPLALREVPGSESRMYVMMRRKPISFATRRHAP